MKNKTAVLCLAVSSLWALAAGCGKTENPSPATTTQADQPTSASKAAATPTVQNLAARATNAAAATADFAKTTLDSAAKAADSVASSTSDAATNAAAGTVDVAKAALAPSNQPAVTAVPIQAPATATVAPTKPSPDQPQPAASQAQTTLASLSEDQMVQGLKDALGKGLQQAIAGLGHDGGFLTNLDVKIPMPEKLQTVEKALRAMHEDKLADDFVATMNHAAEQAVPEAGSVFADAVKQMTIQDAKAILSGPNDAATQYFQRTTQTNLYAKFYPIVQKATEQTGVTAAYKNLMDKANAVQGLGSLGSTLGGALLGKDSMNLDAYVTNKALDGLFKIVAAEEQQIRQNPVARTTDLLKSVFGALQH